MRAILCGMSFLPFYTLLSDYTQPFASAATTRAHPPPSVSMHPAHLCYPMEHSLAPLALTPSSSILDVSQGNMRKSTMSSNSNFTFDTPASLVTRATWALFAVVFENLQDVYHDRRGNQNFVHDKLPQQWRVIFQVPSDIIPQSHFGNASAGWQYIKHKHNCISNDPSWWPLINADFIASYVAVAAFVGVMYDWGE